MAPLFYIDLYKKKKCKIFLFETRRHRPLILGMYIHLIGLHEVVQIIVLGSTTTTQKGSLVLHRLIRENWIKISSCVKLEDLDLLEFYCFLGFGKKVEKKVAILWVLAICRYFWGHFQN